MAILSIQINSTIAIADPGWDIWDKFPFPPPPHPLHLVEKPIIILIKILNVMSDRDQFSYKTHENMYILLAFITNSPQTNVKLAVKWICSTFVCSKRL